jgi:cytochrome bd-type quinol oxidase subunit 2
MLDLFTLAAADGAVLDIAQEYEAIEIVNIAVAYAIIVAIFLSIVFVFYGGISFILSGGQEDRIKQAVSTIRYAIIGLVVSVGAVVIVRVIENIFGLSVTDHIRLGEVVDLISNILSSIDSGSSSGGLDSLD